MKPLATAILVFLLAQGICLAQAKKIPVAVVHSGDDQVGRSVAFALKEAIRGSRSFFLVDNDLKKPKVFVHLVSIDANISGQKGIASAIAIIIVYDSPQTPIGGFYITSGVDYCGSDRIEICAKGVLPDIDEAIETLRREWPALWKTL